MNSFLLAFTQGIHINFIGGWGFLCQTRKWINAKKLIIFFVPRQKA
jgi:hypothetical protein